MYSRLRHRVPYIMFFFGFGLWNLTKYALSEHLGSHAEELQNLKNESLSEFMAFYEDEGRRIFCMPPTSLAVPLLIIFFSSDKDTKFSFLRQTFFQQKDNLMLPSG
jgi:hypothetical protein